MGEKLYRPILEEGEHLVKSKETEGRVRGVSQDTNNRTTNIIEWEEVEVPIGVYEIGVDIPAKHWNIAAANGSFPEITYASKLDASGRSAEWEDIIHNETLLDAEYKYYDSFAGEYPASIDLDLSNGGYLIVEDGAVVFTPYTGKADLGFK